MKRFYETATVAEEDGGFTIHLDGRPVRTPARTPLRIAQRGLADQIADEWQAQATEIRPASMPLTQLATTVMDRVRTARGAVSRAAGGYVESDLVCYRAEEPADLVRAQAARFDSVLEWFEPRAGLSLAVARGILPIAQPAGALETAMAILDAKPDEALAVIHFAVSLTSSFVLGLAFGENVLNAGELFEAGFVDELYQQQKWGRDEEAAARLEGIRRELESLELYRTLTG